MVGVQIEGHADAFVKIRRPENAAYRAEIAEGHIDLRTARAVQTAQRHAHTPELFGGAVDEKDHAIFLRFAESRSQDGEHFVAHGFVHDGLPIPREHDAGPVEVERSEQEQRIGIRDEGSGALGFGVVGEHVVVSEGDLPRRADDELFSRRPRVLLRDDALTDEQTFLRAASEFGICQHGLEARPDRGPAAFVAHAQIVDFRERRSSVRVLRLAEQCDGRRLGLPNLPRANLWRRAGGEQNSHRGEQAMRSGPSHGACRCGSSLHCGAGRRASTVGRSRQRSDRLFP